MTTRDEFSAGYDRGRHRPAQPGELCTCGRPAVYVLITDEWGETGYCGLSDGGRRGPCAFCGGPRHVSERCPKYRIRPGAEGTE